ncbi:DUF3054 domain-containing protein [Enemella sp. A6]|uniref:DUF3054 domain-containing protein n=1 Tax=Enemella sp. A6 TaxID=3440152 RepID=UPI003EBFEEC1
MRSTPVLSWPIALLIDLLAVVVFGVLGRAAHSEALTPGGIAQTTWPFLAALVIGWLVVRVWQAPLRLNRAVLLLVVTVVLGNLLRVFVAQDSTHWTFITVTVLVLAALLAGWRLIALLLLRRRAAATT